VLTVAGAGVGGAAAGAVGDFVPPHAIAVNARTRTPEEMLVRFMVASFRRLE
jgi:hypothetical protein